MCVTVSSHVRTHAHTHTHAHAHTHTHTHTTSNGDYSVYVCSVTDSYREELTHSSHSVNVAQSLPITVPLYSTYTSSRQQPSEHRDEKVLTSETFDM